MVLNSLSYAASDKDSNRLSNAIVEKEILPVRPVSNYYIKNSFPDDGSVKLLRITSQSEMDRIFSPAALMGEGGQPGKVDFIKEQLIAVIAPASQTIEAISVNSLVKNYNQINLNYNISNAAADKSYTSRCFVLLSVDRKFKGRIVAQHDNLPGGDIDEFGCKPSTGYFWSALKQRCVGPGEHEGLLVLDYGGENLAIIFNKERTAAEVIHLKYDNVPYNVLLKGGKVKGKVKNNVTERWQAYGILLEHTDAGYQLYKDGRMIFN